MKEIKHTRKDKKIKNIFVILGPTSTGKTSLALDLCKRFDGEVISADSRQAVKFMDVGTGKSSVDSNLLIEKKDKRWKLNGINVWGYDLTTPDQYFSGYDFAEFALEKTRELEKPGKNIFVVGGTGFYIDLFTGKVRPSHVEPDLELRNSLEVLSLEDLQKKLSSLNLKSYESIDKKNKVRLIRAVEKELLKDLGDSNLNYLSEDSLIKYNFTYFGLNVSRDVLYKRSDAWVDAIWSGGIIEEVKMLIEMGYSESSKLKGLVYRTVLDFINGKSNDKESIQRIKYDIHAYIRRQLTWFKKNKDTKWVDISEDDYKEIIYNDIERKL
ncbi:MAG: tRNA (adenosine(37)-N6)-dimethylallyltransferase MiaA [Patescibacteria group bacterium]